MTVTRFLIILFSSLFLMSCEHDAFIDELEDDNDPTSIFERYNERDSTKNTLPDKTKNESFKILAIGNSFTDDGIAFLPNLLYHAKLYHVKLGKITVGGTSLKYHYDHALLNDNVYSYHVSEGGTNFSDNGKKSLINAVCDDQWDVVVMQQVSQHSGMYQTYQPYLDSLIVLVHRYLPKSIIAWQMTWSYGTESEHSGFSNYDRNQKKMYEAIYNTVKEAVKKSNIDVVIPSGIAIQKLRATSVNNPPLDLTRDGFHLDYGAGRYTVACTWFEALISKTYHTSIIGNTLRTNSGNVHVTDKNALTCQQAASDAVKEFVQNEP